MARKIYIIPADKKPSDYLDAAALADCPEITRGIPPRLAGIIRPEDLPCTYTEPEPEPETPAKITIADLDTRLKAIEAVNTLIESRLAVLEIKAV